MHVLQALLGPVPVREFFHRHFTRVPFATPDQSQAFGWHYDLEEVFIIQVQGCKEYTVRQNTLNPWPVWDNLPAEMRYDRETARVRLTCRLEAGDWLYIPSCWWHIAQPQTASIHLSVGVARGWAPPLYISHRLAWVAQEEAGRPAPSEPAHQRWEDMCAQLQQVLAQEQTCQEFLAYLVDPTRGRSSDRPAHHP